MRSSINYLRGKFLLKLILTGLLFFLPTLYASEDNPTDAEICKLYVATFNRAPDASGLEYWRDNSGLKLSEIAQSFFDQPETQELYPESTTNTEFINSTYQSLFNRDAEADGMTYWLEELNSGNIDKNRFIQSLINGALDSDVSNDNLILENKNEVALHFVNAGFENVEDAKLIMDGITDDRATVSFIKEKIDSEDISTDIWEVYNTPVVVTPIYTPPPLPAQVSPIIKSTATISVNENNTTALTLTATDANGGAISYAISAEDSASFDINSSTGVVSFKVAPDYETKTSYTFTATATDNTARDTTQTVTININNIAEIPTLATLTVAVDENTTVGTAVGNITITDAGDTSITAFTLSDTTNFEINASGYIKTKTLLDYETTTSYTLDVNATNTAGNSANKTVTININNINETPIIATSFSDIIINENNGTTNFELNISDEDGDSLTLSVESNDTSIITISENWTNSILQADYNNQKFDFNISTVVDAYGEVKINIVLEDEDKNSTTFFNIFVEEPNLLPISGGGDYVMDFPLNSSGYSEVLTNSASKNGWIKMEHDMQGDTFSYGYILINGDIAFMGRSNNAGTYTNDISSDFSVTEFNNRIRNYNVSGSGSNDGANWYAEIYIKKDDNVTIGGHRGIDYVYTDIDIWDLVGSSW